MTYFQLKSRENGETFYCLADDAPDWVADVVRDCHDGELPNDWRYAIIADLFDQIATLPLVDEWSDDLVEIVDGLVSIYSHDLHAWATPNRWHYVDDAISNCLGDGSGISEMLSAGQSDCIQQMASQILAVIEENGQQR
jgi:hypothetical protein